MSMRRPQPLGQSDNDATGTPKRPMVLVVEDEQQIRDLMKAVLEVAGYSVITATNGAEGLEVYKEKKDQVEVVVTDWAMPEMNGPDMVRHIQAISPAAKVIIASGSIVHDQQANGPSGASWLQKPYSARELKEAVARLCDPGRNA